MASEFFVSSDVTFGKDAAKELPRILKEFKAKNVMVVYDAGVKMAGIAEKVLAEVEKADVKVVVFDGVIPNPTNEVVEEAAEIAQKENIDVFVAVGGGSSIDLTKAVNILMTNPGPIGQYGGIGLVKEPVLPLIAIPTTAGTSSEITNVVALTDTKAVCKYVIIDNKIVADKVIADPEFTKTMPAGVTAATGMDAITHAVESYISNMSTALTEYHSIKALQIFHEYLPKAVANGADMEAREKMMLGCLIAGFGFSNANLGMVLGRVCIQISQKKLLVDDKELPLTKAEYEICEFLAKNRGQVFSKEQILEEVFGFDSESNDSTIITHIKNIRAKFADYDYTPIKTVWGIGYKWEE